VLRYGCINWRQITRYNIYPFSADDQVLITQENEGMEFMVTQLLEEYEMWGLKINLDKTFYMGC
jgi:hypothetical protein